MAFHRRQTEPTDAVLEYTTQITSMDIDLEDFGIAAA
jgi:hypothetical protein